MDGLATLHVYLNFRTLKVFVKGLFVELRRMNRLFDSLSLRI